jgi:chromosomal replication initiator protein
MLETTISHYIFPGLKHKEEFLKTRKFKRDRISKEEILSIVAKNCCVNMDDILSRSRKREVIDARFMFIAVMRKEFGHSLKFIGEMCDRDHTSIMHAVGAFHDRYRNYGDYKGVADGIFDEIKNRIY